MTKPPRHRPRRVFEKAERVIIECELRECPHCGQRLKPRQPWHIRKTIQTLSGPLFVADNCKDHRACLTIVQVAY